MGRAAVDPNVVLVGMPGVGKSTVGVLLAKALSRPFIDTDLVIQAGEGERLQDILNAQGLDAFCAIEEHYVLGLNCRATVIATGGSVVYSARAMQHLQASGVVVYLEMSLPLLEQRLPNLDSRGVVMPAGATLGVLFRERRPLYERYADATVDCAGRSHEAVLQAILEQLAVLTVER